MKYVRRYVRDVCIGTLIALGVVRMHQAYTRRTGPLVRVIVFHDVQDGVWFERIIAHLKRHYHTLTPEQFLTRAFHKTKINILITFDDGYASWMNVCAPVLQKYHLSALFFINSGIMGVAEREDEARAFMYENLLLSTYHPLITYTQVHALMESGHTVGSHTVQHRRLSILSPDEQRQEILGDKETLEQYTHIPISAFAYPFGRDTDYNDLTIEEVKNAGFTHAFTTRSAFVSQNGNPYTIPRTCIEDGLTVTHFDRWMKGGYDLLNFIKYNSR